MVMDPDLAKRLTDADVFTIGNAFDVAAEQYQKDAKHPCTTPRLVEQFEWQAAECKRLADILTRGH